jgi:hypothetical protein
MPKHRSKILRIPNPRFRTAYILKPGFIFRALRPYCEEIIYSTDGFKTRLDEIMDQLLDSFAAFDPEQDCIVPTGTSTTNMLAGLCLAKMFPDQPIAIAIYNKEMTDPQRGIMPEDYIFYRVPQPQPQFHDLEEA